MFPTLSIFGCTTASTAPELDVGSAAQPLQESQNSLDGAEPRGPAILDMVSGHAARVPVTEYYQKFFTLGAAGQPHTFSVTTSNCSGDSGLLVRVLDGFGNHIKTLYNDDGPAPGSDATGSSPWKSSRISTGNTGFTMYEVFAFSQDRATAHCSIWTSYNGGSWLFDSAPQLGGALVEVGPLASNSFLEVRTKTNGKTSGDIDDTKMVLFDVGAPGEVTGQGLHQSTNAPLLAQDQSWIDYDPRIDLGATDAWLTTRNFALIGKKITDTDSTRTVQTMVELVRGPLNQNRTSFTVNQSGGATGSVTLTPGRYAMWVEAQTTSSVGSTSLVENLGKFGGCAKHYPRGQLNGPGFVMELERASTRGIPDWKGSHQRRVALGAFGADNMLQRFVLEFTVPSTALYRINIHDVAPNVSFGTTGKVVRNADSTDFKVAGLNMLYNDDGPPGAGGIATIPKFKETPAKAEYRNASNLLATRGTVDVATKRVIEERDQTPYQWDSDVVFLTENTGTYLLEMFEEEAESRGPRRWSMSYGETESYDDTPADLSQLGGQGAVYVADNLWPTADEDSARVPYAYLPDKCERDNRWVQCRVIDTEWSNFKFKNAIPARVNVRREGGQDRPVLVFGLHLLSGAGKDEFEGRRSEVNGIANRVEEILTKNGAAQLLNKDGTADLDAEGNRLVLVGDWNSYAHGCGEHYWLLRRLRERFGFAVDVAMADTDADHWGYGMHNFTQNLDDKGLPVPYGDRGAWTELPGDKWVHPVATSGTLSYPWYARTFRSTRAEASFGGDRHDMIILVGKGWASDDAVRAYNVMQDNDRYNPFTVNDDFGLPLGGVNMYGKGNAMLTVGKPNYRPNHELGWTWCEAIIGPLTQLICVSDYQTKMLGKNRGSPALFTDHLPIAARLRVLTTGDSTDR
jgi:hypothetical protein